VPLQPKTYGHVAQAHNKGVNTMPSNQDFVHYVCEQIASVGEIRFRKMFGEYMVYVNDKPIFLVCDNTVFAKMASPLLALLGDAETGFPYPGAKPNFIIEVDNGPLICAVATALERITLVPTQKRKAKS